jgi:hypothetical protein
MFNYTPAQADRRQKKSQALASFIPWLQWDPGGPPAILYTSDLEYRRSKQESMAGFGSTHPITGAQDVG